MAKKIYNSTIQEHLEVLKSEKKSIEEKILRAKIALKDLDILKYRIEGAISTLIKISSEDK